jgi:hypothetical protein
MPVNMIQKVFSKLSGSRMLTIEGSLEQRRRLRQIQINVLLRDCSGYGLSEKEFALKKLGFIG